jgi:hypothetical protein
MPNVFPLKMTRDVNIMLTFVILCTFCVNFTVDTGDNMFHFRDSCFTSVTYVFTSVTAVTSPFISSVLDIKVM